MDTLKIKLNNDDARKMAIARLEMLAINSDAPLELTIKDWKKNRSLDQLRLYWSWITILANEFGNTKDDLHQVMKKNHLVPILERADPVYAKMMQDIRGLWKSGQKSAAEMMVQHVTRLTSTSGLKVSQMTEYLEAILSQAVTAGIKLPLPEDKRL